MNMKKYESRPRYVCNNEAEDILEDDMPLHDDLDNFKGKNDSNKP